MGIGKRELADFLEAGLPRLLAFARKLRREYRLAVDPEDLVQEAFLAVWKNREGFRGDATLATYARTSVLRVALNLVRERSMRRRRSREAFARGIDVRGALNGRVTRAAESEAAEALAEEVAEALQSVSPRLQRLLARWASGEDYRRLVRRYRWPIGTVRSRLHRAKAELARPLRAKRRDGLLDERRDRADAATMLFEFVS